MLALSGDVTRCFRLHAIKLLTEISLYYSVIFVGRDARFGFVPRCRVPSLLIFTPWFMKDV